MYIKLRTRRECRLSLHFYRFTRLRIILVSIFCQIKRVLQVEYGKIWRERVNRYVIVSLNMLTNIFGYGIIHYEVEARLSEGK